MNNFTLSRSASGSRTSKFKRDFLVQAALFEIGSGGIIHLFVVSGETEMSLKESEYEGHKMYTSLFENTDLFVFIIFATSQGEKTNSNQAQIQDI